MKMNKKQFERYMEAYEKRTESLDSISSSINDLGQSVEGMYNGQGKSAFWGISQAMFAMIERDSKSEGYKTTL